MFILLHRIVFRVVSLLRRARIEDEFDSEIQTHLDLIVQENLRRGMSLAEARRAAALTFGGITQIHEKHRDVRGISHLEALRQDVRFAFRQMRKSPGFTAIAVSTLALGIGACTTIFSVVDAVLLRALPYQSPDRLVWIWSTDQRSLQNQTAGADYLDWVDQNHSFDGMAAFKHCGVTLTGAADPEVIMGDRVSASFFTVLGVSPLRGRGFLPDDERPAGDQVVILSNELWRGQFGGDAGGDAGILGRQITLDSRSYTVVGVLPQGFIPFDGAKIWLPYSFGRDELSRGNRLMNVIGRLRPEVSSAEAQQEMDAITGRLRRQYPDSNTDRKALIVPLQERLVGESRAPLLALLGAVALVLLIACANIANLFLARAASRQREFAIRSALGATRRRLFRQLLTEGLTVSLSGGTLGVALAHFATPALIALSPRSFTEEFQIGINGRVLAVTLAVSLLTCIASGLAPGLKSRGPDPGRSFTDGGRNSSMGSASHRMNNAVIVSEIALSLVLLVGAGLLIRTFYHLRYSSPGFVAANVLTAEITLPQSRYANVHQQFTFYRTLLERVKALPGVRSAALISDLPLGGSSTTGTFDIEGRPDWTPGQEPSAEKYAVSSDYFRSMGIPLRQGREFNDKDVAGASGVAIVSESFARRFWSDEDAIGKRLNLGWYNGQWQEIVGIVGDVKQTRLDAEAPIAAYMPILQVPKSGMRLVIGPDNGAIAQTAALRTVLRSIDPELPLFSVQYMDALVSTAVERQRFNMLLTGLFAAVALFLTGVGTYGVVSYSVTQRTREIGIRMALGAHPVKVMGAVMRRGMLLSMTGIAIGLMLAFGLTRVIGALLYEVSATDPATFVMASGVLACAAIIACYRPARQAASVDPINSLRSE